MISLTAVGLLSWRQLVNISAWIKCVFVWLGGGRGGADYSLCVCVNFVINTKGVGSELLQRSDMESRHGVIYHMKENNWIKKKGGKEGDGQFYCKVSPCLISQLSSATHHARAVSLLFMTLYLTWKALTRDTRHYGSINMKSSDMGFSAAAQPIKADCWSCALSNSHHNQTAAT